MANFPKLLGHVAALSMAWLAPGASSVYAHSLQTQPAGLPGWSFDPLVVTLWALSCVVYAFGYGKLRARSVSGRRARGLECVAFALGLGALLAALMSPLDGLGASLFSAHMLQHEMLMIVAAPLLVLGRPLPVWLWAFPARARRRLGHGVRWGPFQAAWRILTLPVSAWGLHAAVLWGWHLPGAFEAALRHPWVHTLQHLSFLLSALLFWWTILPRGRAGPNGHAMLSLFTTMVHTGALGALLTLAPAPWYPWYALSSPALGFDPLEDQQLGGLVMWVPGGLAYVIAGLAVAAQWLVRRDDDAGCLAEGRWT